MSVNRREKEAKFKTFVVGRRDRSLSGPGLRVLEVKFQRLLIEFDVVKAPKQKDRFLTIGSWLVSAISVPFFQASVLESLPQPRNTCKP